MSRVNSKSTIKAPVSESFLVKLQALRTATLLKIDSCETCETFKNTYFTQHLQWLLLTVSDFQPPSLLKKIPAKMFFCKFWEVLRSWLLLKFIYESWEVFQNISFIEHLWQTAYFKYKYKLQYFNQQILWKFISRVLFKHFIQEREVAVRRRSLT